MGKNFWRRDRLPTPVFLGFPCGSAGEESSCNVGDLSWIPGLGRSPGEGKAYQLQYSGLENSLDCMYSPWGHKESDTTERLSLSLSALKHIISPLANFLCYWLKNSFIFTEKYLIIWIMQFGKLYSLDKQTVFSPFTYWRTSWLLSVCGV